MRALAIAAALTLAAGGASATARPLPDTGIRVEKPIVATITVTSTAAGIVQVVPAGDLAVGYACHVTAAGDGSGAAVCVQDTGDGYVFTCNRVDVADNRVPGVLARGYCADDTREITADYDSTNFGAYNGWAVGSKLAANRVYCAATGPKSTPFSVTCTFKVLSVMPIDGGVTISQATQTSAVVATPFGVLAVDDLWDCAMDIGTPPPAPTVTCNRDDTRVDWFCQFTDVTATAPGPLPSVRGQVSCDGNKLPIPPGRTGQTLSTTTVPGFAGTTTDYYGAMLDHPTTVFICQAWGPLNTPVPIAPWSVTCYEP